MRLSPEEEALVDQDVLDYLKLDPQSPSDEMDADRSMTPLVAHGAATWDQLCGDLDALLSRISLSVPKSEFGKRVIPYLSHEIGAEGIRATPKIIKGIHELPFPSTLNGVQSFLGSLNYYHKFIEEYAVVAASLYELTDD
ncbi:reverse transcriptase [Phytophthora megakarya]|uniref:Reverse transcriptase n=1 Tax=Phytophthora megakarya TaxID=4795 RepID=A0A225WXR4_9STRA|nr:reverse transcriptase [Phytophthora megakarya]